MRIFNKKTKRIILFQILIIITFNTIFIYVKGNTTNNFETNYLDSIYFDFETDLDNWTLTLETEGSQFYLTNLTSYDGNSSVCMTNRTRYTYYLNDENYIKMTNNTMITFSWGFPNKEGHYIGIMIGTTLASLCIMSHFEWTYVNTTEMIIKSYEYESTYTWHYHTLNLSDLFLDYFDAIPEYITTIGLRNRGPGIMSSTDPGDQIAYYDEIMINTSGEILDPNPDPKPIPEIEGNIEPEPTDPTTTDPESGLTIILRLPSIGYLFGSIIVISSIMIISIKKRKNID